MCLIVKHIPGVAQEKIYVKIVGIINLEGKKRELVLCVKELRKKLIFISSKVLGWKIFEINLVEGLHSWTKLEDEVRLPIFCSRLGCLFTVFCHIEILTYKLIWYHFYPSNEYFILRGDSGESLVSISFSMISHKIKRKNVLRKAKQSKKGLWNQNWV